MKHLNTILSTLLALPFIVFGFNYFVNFMPAPPLEGDIAVFVNVLVSSGFMTVTKVLEIILGFMILLNFQRPLALVLLAPIVVNIFMFEVLITRMPAIGVILFVINAVLIYRYRVNYVGMIVRKNAESPVFEQNRV